MNSFESNGYWWLPSNPDNQVPGVIKFTAEEGIELSLLGSLNESARSGVQHSLIVGILENGKEITLYRNILIKIQIPHPGFFSQQYTAEIGFIGYNFTQSSEMLFYKAVVDYSYLRDWAMIPYVHRESILNENNQMVGMKFNDYHKPLNIVAKTTEGIISVKYGFSEAGKLTDLDFKQSAAIVIEPENDFSLEILNERFIYPLQNLLTFATGKPNSIVSCDVCYDSRNIEVIFKQSMVQKRTDNLLHPTHMLFTVEDIKDQFGLSIQQWLNAHKEIDSVCNLFFSTKYSRLYLQNEFLNIVQAVESYHRRRRKNNYLLEADHTKRIEEILENTPDLHKQWVKEKLHFSNEPTLKDRLKELVQENILVINSLLGFYKTPDKFIIKVKNTRNFLTHYNKSNENKAAKETELFWMTKILEFLLQACFLSELGCSLEKRAEIISSKSRYHWAVEEINKLQQQSNE
ncbi:MAG: HEPN domain-containing protein [Planktothrix sp.]